MQVGRVETFDRDGRRVLLDVAARAQTPRQARAEVGTGWPRPLAEEALYGLAGGVVRDIEPYSEADPVAILSQELMFFGNVIGASAHFRVESDIHRANINAVLVGETAKGRKGTSKGRVSEVFTKADPDWIAGHVAGGLSSGEGLIWAVRDPVYSYVRDKRAGEAKMVMSDPGIDDKRLLVTETEFARVLKMARREGNIVSEVIRQAWDVGSLRSMTKNSPATATGTHISIAGHITKDELLRCFSETDQANGFANRFLWVCVRRSKYLPDDEDRRVDPEVIANLQERIKDSVGFARGVGEMHRDEEARLAWRAVYKELSEGRPGLLGAVLARAEAQVLRLSMIYALMDKSHVIRLPHLKAAIALWEYCERSARYIFGDALGDPTADTILRALRDSRAGITRTEISSLFGRNKPAQEIARALGVLASLGLATSVGEETQGRSVERWSAL